MQQKFYTIAMVDKTKGGSLSKFDIKSGAKSSGEDESGGELLEKVAGQIGHKLTGQMINSVSSAAGFNLGPSFNLGKAILSGAGGAIASAGIALASQVVSLIINSISNKIAELRQEAAEANERDNQLILSGSLDISGYTIRKGKYGRDEYVYNRG